ncbi:MAG: hypothetical protein RIS35_1017, partial [Pseudomonadota bacterium]
MSQAAQVVVKPSNGKPIQVPAKKTIRITTEAGVSYRLLEQTGDREVLRDNVIAVRKGSTLKLKTTDGAEVEFERFFDVCRPEGGCGLTVAGDRAEGYTLHAGSAGGVVVQGGEARLVYAHGVTSTLAGLADGDSGLSGVLASGSAARTTYVPSDSMSFAWLGGAGLLGLAAGGGGGGGSSPANNGSGQPEPPPGDSEANGVRVLVIGGPVISTHSLEVEIYTADGRLIGIAELDDRGQLTVSVDDYRGVIIAKVRNDPDQLPDYLDEATGDGKDLQIDLFAMGVIEEKNSVITLNLNLLSTLAYREATSSAGIDPLAGRGVLDPETVHETNDAIAGLFGLEDLHGDAIVTTNARPGEELAYRPDDGLSDPERYGAILAALSGMDLLNGGDVGKTLDQMLAGVSVSGGTASLTPDLLSSIVAGAEVAAPNAIGDLVEDVFGLLPVPPDTTAPVLQSAVTSTDGSKVVLTYDEALDGTNKAGVGTFEVKVGGIVRTVTGVSVSGTTVTLTLASAIGHGESVTV